jgi:hypothetical protein
MQLSLAFRFILPWAGKIGSARFQRAVVDWVPWKAVHDFRDIVDIMDYTTQQIFDAKKSALNLVYARPSSFFNLAFQLFTIISYLIFTVPRTLTDVVLPLATPLRGRDDAAIHAIHVPRGTDLMLSIQSANCATSIWGPDAAKWKPARWLEPLPGSVIGAPVTGVYQHL